MVNNILKVFLEKGFLLDSEMLEFFNQLDDIGIAQEVINKIKFLSAEKVITKNLINSNLEKLEPVFVGLDQDKKKIVEKFFVNISVSVEVKREVVVEDVVEVKDLENSGQSSLKIVNSPMIANKKIEVRDFVRHFRSRYNFFKNLLQEKSELNNLTSIDKIGGNREISLIAIVSKKLITKNGNLLLDVEDLTGKTKLLITKTKEEIFDNGKEIVLDDIIGFNCSGSSDFLFVNDLIYPDSYIGTPKKATKDNYVIFTSDIHVGSRNFLKENFERFISWLNDSKNRELVDRIKFMFIVGDTIDGVGVYPGQEKELEIPDIKEQYAILANYLDQIPKHIKIIQCAGQHDSVRVAEPQPPVGEDFAEPLTKIENLYLVSNPTLVEIADEIYDEAGGLKILMYHGASMHGLIGEIEELRLNDGHANPARVVKHLLLRRHLAPSHGSAIYIPDAQGDPMIIREVPDVITTGDLHKTDIDSHNNILIICNSCWQSITAFEEKVGNKPDPCKVPLLNLKTREVKILDFS